MSVLKGEKEVRKLVKGDSFGEQALYYNCARTMTCRAAEDNVLINLLIKKQLIILF